jgi:polyisoprenyl-teichoic acid--peptidoglycan teichoic acid transferase
MSHFFLPSSRPAVFLGISALLVGALALSGCSTSPKKVAAPATTTVATAAVVPPPPVFTASGVPASLAAVIKRLYYGGAVPASASAGLALHKRKPVAATQAVVVKAAGAKWKGVPIAVVTSGKDVTLAVAAPQWKVVGGWWPSIGLPAPSLGGARRILMVGSDARPGQAVNGSRGDSLHIVGLDGRGRGGILGIPRDSYVSLATGGRGKINSALTFGGASGLQRTVVSLTGVRLEGYMITGFGGFTALINGLGRLPVSSPVAVKDKMSGANVRRGGNKLNGAQALAFGRARHGVAGGDFGRSANQGRIIMAAAGFAKLLGPSALPGILGKAAPSIATNLSAEQVLTFAAGALVTDPKKVPNKVAIGGFGWTPDRQSIVLLDANARRMFTDIRDGNLS